MLLASSTTEGMNGGHIRSSEAAIQLDGPRVRLTRDASCISYGAEADAIVSTARRGESAANSDQVLVVFEKENYTLERTKSWDTLGMRGTCSVGYLLIVLKNSLSACGGTGLLILSSSMNRGLTP